MPCLLLSLTLVLQLVESEMVATNSQSRCREQGIPFYRFSPKLRDVIAGSETDNEKLFNMVIQTRIDTREQGMEEMVRLFHTIAGASHHLAPRTEEETAPGPIERENDYKNKYHHQEVQKKSPELNANLNDQPGLLKVASPSSSSQSVLSDIEESVEQSSKKSYKLQQEGLHSNSSQPSALATFVVGDEAVQDAAGSGGGQVSAQTAETTGGDESKETNGPSERDIDVVRRSESTDASALGKGVIGGEREINVALDRLATKTESQAREGSPQNDNDVTRSQNSSVFSSELASPYDDEPEASSPHINQESSDGGGGGDDKGLNTESQVSPDIQSSKDVNTVEDVVVKEAVTSSLEPATSPSDLAMPSSVKQEDGEIEGINKPQIVLKELKKSSKEPTAHPVEMNADQNTPPVASQGSAEDTRMPPDRVTPDEPVKNLSSIDRPSSISTQQDLGSCTLTQQTYLKEEENDASSRAVTDAHNPPSSSQQDRGSSLTSCELVITSEKFAGERRREEVWSNQMKQEGLDMAKEERPGPAVNGGSVIRVTIPMGSSHSSFISLESPQISGPPKKKIPRTASDERGIPNGDVHFVPPLTAPSTAAAGKHSIEIQSDVGLVNGHKPHSQVPKLENGSDGHGEVPTHYKLDIQLTPQTQLDAQSKFPYRFETEI